ncbi:VWA domain-containing protein [Intrasporangium calvum]|uniref:VWA domain-containing protein n=1 Tax=Intrasporangium calvum TaxID=53358 RepID=A0ABT5GEV5_9MICO|nr:VWA domain-containing protein [Intrasporangium calvum]MDC5696355.1 VWA domain-containing protein [Intrasporangium calvum]
MTSTPTPTPTPTPQSQAQSPAPGGPPWAAEAWLLGFARALRAAGLPVTADRERTFLVALGAVGLGERRHVYWTGRATLTSSPADVERYDQVFAAWFSADQPTRTRRPDREVPPATRAALDQTEGSSGGEADDEAVRARASGQEVLRHRDVATLDVEERQALARLFGALHPRPPRRRARRHVRSRRGEVDGPATLRAQLRWMGEPGRIHHRARGSRPRRVVLLIDVSGSMSAYADSLLRLAHTFVQAAGPRGAVEVFTMGTRLTHVTRALRERDPDRALVAAGEAVPDWSGGTRLGESIAVFLDRWGRRGMARGAVVVVFSDGWERQGPELLGEQLRRLAALAHRVVWSNPHRGKAGYLPVQQGIVAVLPHVDDFVAGHSLATFEELIEVVARA